MEGQWSMDERRWREKVRRFEFEAKDLKAERDKLREELNQHLGKPIECDFSEYEAKIAALTAENKELKDKIKGLNMQLGRLKSK